MGMRNLFSDLHDDLVANPPNVKDILHPNVDGQAGSVH